MAITLSLIYKQFFPPKPTLTETNLPNLSGKHFIITGATSGVGLDLTHILYSAGGTVYMFTRNTSKTVKVISDIKTSCRTETPGTLHHIYIDLSDLTTITPAVKKFHALSSELDILFNNVGVSNIPLSARSAQGIEMHFATNCLGPHLLTKLSLPSLPRPQKPEPPEVSA
jgi:NAD(P)-dependent dehydrogenase (short-subunit alcohol dehydrogenase family)